MNISEVDNLTGNDTPVFQALVKEALPQDALYWRGNILSQNDGWNWRRSYGESVMSEAKESSPEGISQKIRILGKEDYFFALDHPEALVYAGKMNRPIAGSSLNQRTWQWVSSYEAFSLSGGRLKAPPPSEGSELQNMLSKRDQAWIQKTFPAQELSEIQGEVQQYFKAEQFVYSLAPGRITNFRAFMDRKIGFCSHYASAMALILRTKGIPSRLVSGFMGGSFNRFASYYLINQNDAHVWVEAYSGGEWRKLDPTEWIAPERVRLGGEAFMTQNSSVGLQGIARRLNLKFIQDLQFWFKQWDFKFYTFIDEMDYHGQSAWLYKLNLKRIWLYALLPIILFGFLGLHAYHSRHRKVLGEDEIYQELWRLFIKRVRKRGIQLGTVALSQQEELIQASQLRASDKDKILKVRRKLIETSFGSRSSPELRAEIKGL